ncbi:MAG TPA: PIN domain-containing protein [Terracidiphilus sp.]|nr:PIN domain-containing protein [Terracidiphilus sp.]
MSDRYFLDTNIFVYSFDSAAPAKARKAQDLIAEALATGKGVVSYQVVQEFFNAALRRFALPMKIADAERYLTSVFRPLLGVQSSGALFSQALLTFGKNKLSWYDSLIVAAALQANCDLLYSEDMQHGQKYGNLRVVNPFL